MNRTALAALVLSLAAAAPCRALDLPGAYVRLASAVASERPAPNPCREESLVRFESGGAPVPAAEKAGEADPCDGFGGDLARSPKHGVYVYVNFNVSGTVDLDAFDRSLDERVPPELREGLAAIQFAFVTREWVRRLNDGEDREAFMDRGATTLYISERVLAEGTLKALLDDFFDRLSTLRAPSRRHST